MDTVILENEHKLVLPEHAVRPAPGRGRSWLTRRTALTVAAITLVGLVLRVALIDTQSLRLDESLSLNQVLHHSLFGLWNYLVTGNVHVPLYHTILYGWVRLVGTAEWQIRIPSVVFGTAAIPVFFLVGRRIAGTRAAVFAAAIGAASPLWIWHSDEARMYPLLLFMVLASTALMFQALDRGGFWRWAAYAVVTGLSFYTHYFALLMPPVQFAFVLIYRFPRRKVLAWFGAMTGAALMFLPWLIALYTLRIEASGVSSLANGVRLHAQSYTVFGITYSLIAFLLVFVVGYGAAIGNGAGPLAVLSYMVVCSWPLVALVGVTARRVGEFLRSRAFAFLMTWLVFMVGVVFVANAVKPGLFIQRYLIVASAPLFLLVGIGLARLIRPTAIALALVLVSFGALSVVEAQQVGNPAREDFRGAAAAIEAGYQPGDAVILMPSFYSTPMEYYVRGRYPVDLLLQPGQSQQSVITDSLPEIYRHHQGKNLWVIMPYESVFDPGRVIRTSMNASLRLDARYRLGGDMELRKYTVPIFPPSHP
jgi:mannosyltransferase